MEHSSNLVSSFLRLLSADETTHPQFAGQELDARNLGPCELGELLPEAWRIYFEDVRSDLAIKTAYGIIERARVIAPRFRPRVTVEALESLAAVYEADVEHQTETRFGALLEFAALAVRHCDGPLPDMVSRILPRFLLTFPLKPFRPYHFHEAYVRLALATGCEAPVTDQILLGMKSRAVSAPLACDELDTLRAMPIRDALTLADVTATSVGDRSGEEIEPPDRYPLVDIAGYAKFAERAWASAGERVRHIHDGVVPYDADKAFVPVEGQVLGRVARVGLDRDTAWFRETLRSVWIGVSTAPDPKVKTMPSQSVSIALGRAVEERPTPHAVAVMRDVQNVVRHAGVKKKLKRLQRTAERRLAAQPDLILRLVVGEPIPKALISTVKRSIETLYRSSEPMEAAQWTERFLSQTQIRPLAQMLIWRLEAPDGETRSGMPIATRRNTVWQSAEGDEISPSGISKITLWHPLSASSAERAEWRDFIVKRQIKQPFSQAFRQYYRPNEQELKSSETFMFDGHDVSVRELVGVAQAAGWRLGDDVSFHHVQGPLRLGFDCGRTFHPGDSGIAKTGRLYVKKWVNGRYAPVPLSSIDQVLLSEVLRSTDLLTSVGAFAFDPTVIEAIPNPRRHTSGLGTLGGCYLPPNSIGVPVGQSAHMRREVLKRLYSGMEGVSDVAVGERHVEVGAHVIHIATGRVTCNGDPIDVDLSTDCGSVIWLPHEDEILHRIVRIVSKLLER